MAPLLEWSRHHVLLSTEAPGPTELWSLPDLLPGSPHAIVPLEHPESFNDLRSSGPPQALPLKKISFLISAGGPNAEIPEI